MGKKGERVIQLTLPIPTQKVVQRPTMARKFVQERTVGKKFRVPDSWRRTEPTAREISRMGPLDRERLRLLARTISLAVKGDRKGAEYVAQQGAMISRVPRQEELL